MKKGIIIIGAMVFSSSAPATIINIPGDYPTIQQGIDASSDGDTVLVQPGTYVESVNFNGHNTVLASLFLTTGDDYYITETVIDCECLDTIIIENGESESAALIGFSILSTYYWDYNRGILCYNSSPRIEHNEIYDHYILDPGAGIMVTGNSSPIISGNHIAGNSSDESSGAGIACLGYSTPQIVGNYISGNDALIHGGGIFCGDNSSAFIMDNRISSNRGVYSGGGIHCGGFGETIIKNNVIINNESYWKGGGIYCANSFALVENNTIQSNYITPGYFQDYIGGGIYCLSDTAVLLSNMIQNNRAVYGGGIYFRNSRSIFSNNSVLGNISDSLGGGIYCSASSPKITNNIIRHNSASLSGAGIFCALVSNPIITNTILWRDSAGYDAEIDFDDSSSPAFRYSNIQGGWEGQGNIDIDPLLRDPENGDYHLMSTACGDPFDSPCIDAGDPALIDSLLDCSWGLGELRSDMGAYGGGDSATVDIDDFLERLPSLFALLQNYPNPFNPSTTIRYSLPEQSDVRIEIYNILGQKVATLFEGRKQAGYHTVTWRAADFASGFYFARLEAGDRSENVKMVLLK